MHVYWDNWFLRFGNSDCSQLVCLSRDAFILVLQWLGSVSMDNIYLTYYLWCKRFGLVGCFAGVYHLGGYQWVSEFVLWYTGYKLLNVCGVICCTVVGIFGENNLYPTLGMTSVSRSVKDWCQTELAKLLQTQVDEETVEWVRNFCGLSCSKMYFPAIYSPWKVIMWWKSTWLNC